MDRLHPGRAGFTLIELLIVVAIIAILAAIAVPNFLEAQVRSKVSRVHADLRSLGSSLEAYRVDNTAYPELGVRRSIDSPVPLTMLSTPIAYITNPLIRDPFKAQGMLNSNNRTNVQYIYARMERVLPQEPSWGVQGVHEFFSHQGAFPLVNGYDISTAAKYPGPYHWLLCSYGPDFLLQLDNDPGLQALGQINDVYMPYDATNGSKSQGDVFRFGP